MAVVYMAAVLGPRCADPALRSVFPSGFPPCERVGSGCYAHPGSWLPSPEEAFPTGTQRALLQAQLRALGHMAVACI